MKLIRFVIVAFLFVFLNANNLVAEEVINITNGEWEPFLSKNFPHYGVASHIVTEAFAEVGIKVKYGFFPWKRAYQNAATGRWDASVIWGRTKERDKNFLYSVAVLEDSDIMFHLKSRPFSWSTVEDLRGLKIGGNAGSAYPLMEEAAKNKIIKLERAQTYKANFGKLILKRIHAMRGTKIAAYAVLRKEFPPEQQKLIAHYINESLDKVWEYHVLFPKKSEKSARRMNLFNKGYQQLKQKGRLDEIWKGFYQGDYDKKSNK